MLLCPEIAVKITEHTVKRQERDQGKRINIDLKISEEDDIDCKKRKLIENEKVDENGNGNKNENEKRNESSSYEHLKKKNNFSPLINRQILFDATAGEFHNFNLPPLNPSCAVCGPQSTIFTMEDSGRDLECHMLRLAQVTIFSFLTVFIFYFYNYFHLIILYLFTHPCILDNICKLVSCEGTSSPILFINLFFVNSLCLCAKLLFKSSFITSSFFILILSLANTSFS